MIFKPRHIPIKSISVFLIFIVGIFALNEYFYIHKHICKDGSIVVHAHPYNKSQDSDQRKSHEHSAGDLVYLASLESFLPASILIFIAGLSSVTFSYKKIKEILYPKFYFLFNHERAPPIFA
jgi:hypothetical protein